MQSATPFLCRPFLNRPSPLTAVGGISKLVSVKELKDTYSGPATARARLQREPLRLRADARGRERTRISSDCHIPLTKPVQNGRSGQFTAHITPTVPASLSGDGSVPASHGTRVAMRLCSPHLSASSVDSPLARGAAWASFTQYSVLSCAGAPAQSVFSAFTAKDFGSGPNKSRTANLLCIYNCSGYFGYRMSESPR